eukprot:TRINITY_DN3714_c0_g1_i3.p1 TRINITY_DN3714_c0_g1~~TRINITY_DN3714_c0_g1_i3.p1  ORF type:complete len:192 (+),score=34.65 TRINITY_DN3714_c0_g1_i3:66-641(+)
MSSVAANEEQDEWSPKSALRTLSASLSSDSGSDESDDESAAERVSVDPVMLELYDDGALVARCLDPAVATSVASKLALWSRAQTRFAPRVFGVLGCFVRNWVSAEKCLKRFILHFPGCESECAAIMFSHVVIHAEIPDEIDDATCAEVMLSLLEEEFIPLQGYNWEEMKPSHRSTHGDHCSFHCIFVCCQL